MRYTLVAALAAVALLVTAGTAAAAGVGFAAPPADDRPLDGTNSPWLADDWRLDRIQDRYDLTDAQVDEVQAAVEAAVADGATPTETRTVVHETLADFGIDAEALGPPADAPRGFADGDYRGIGSGGQPGTMNGQEAMPGQGGFGLRDGSCLR
ncbi:MAG: hypothetical protein ABEJ67_06745 [Halanaeroarchaeum sp.]